MQAFEVIEGSRKLNDYADQALYTLLTCHGGIDLEDGDKLAMGTQLGLTSKDRQLLYSCDIDSNELTSKEWYALLDHCIRLRAPRLYYCFLHEEAGVESTDTHHHRTVDLCVLRGHYEEALAVFDTSIAYGMEPTVHNFSPLLKSCGSATKARELLQRMEHCGISPNVISYTAAIKSCEPSGNLESVLAIMELMRSCGVEPNEVTYCCVISVASKGMQGTLMSICSAKWKIMVWRQINSVMAAP